MNAARFAPALALLLIIPVLPACRRDEVTVYRIPKEAEPPTAAAAGHREADWNVPPGWEEQPAVGMRAGSFRARASNGAMVDISVVQLAGEAGGELANVNRWRGQLKLPPVDAKKLSTLVTSARVGPHDVRLVEFAEGGQRLLAAVIRRGRWSWFFKATGDDRAVAEIRPAFLAFVESVRFHAHE